jgi:hypothetical protein
MTPRKNDVYSYHLGFGPEWYYKGGAFPGSRRCLRAGHAARASRLCLATQRSSDGYTMRWCVAARFVPCSCTLVGACRQTSPAGAACRWPPARFVGALPSSQWCLWARRAVRAGRLCLAARRRRPASRRRPLALLAARSRTAAFHGGLA